LVRPINLVEPLLVESGQAAPQESDMGRLNEILIKGKRGKQLLVLTANRVCMNHAATDGPTTSYSNSRRQNVQNPDPRKQFIMDLEVHVASALSNRQGLLIMLDANSDFTQWVRCSGLPVVYIHLCASMAQSMNHTPHCLHACF
jgi:predicted nucleic acid-binding Zn ribbon protein